MTLLAYTVLVWMLVIQQSFSIVSFKAITKTTETITTNDNNDNSKKNDDDNDSNNNDDNDDNRGSTIRSKRRNNWVPIEFREKKKKIWN